MVRSVLWSALVGVSVRVAGLGCAPADDTTVQPPPVASAERSWTVEQGSSDWDVSVRRELDQARASAAGGPWNPSWTTHPRLMFGPEDKATLQARMARTDEPFPTLAGRIRSGCSATPAVYDDPDGLDQAAIYTNGNIARNCAFLAWLNQDATSASKAISILLAWPPDLGKVNQEHFDNTDIHVGEALSSAAQAYDLLLGTSFVSSTDQSSIEANLLGMAESSYHIYVELFSFWYKFQNNNHKGKLASALALVGMTLNQEDVANTYVSYGVTELQYVLQVQVSAEGGYAEGPYYLNYGSETYLPLMIAWHRYAQGQTLSVDQTCETRPRNEPCKPGPVEVPDFYTDPFVHSLYRWWIAISMPDGLAPDFDDSNRGGTFLGILAGMTGDGSFRAAWERNKTSPYYSRDCQDLTVETLTLFPETLPATWPGWTSRFLPGAGTATFRSDWTEQARYLLLLAEQGQMVTGGHEQPDGTSILLSAWGEYLVRDSGYGSWDQRQEVSGPESHSLVLIDGQGPHDSIWQASYGAQTALEACSQQSGFERCDASTAFSEVDVVRSVYFLKGTSFVLVDRLTPQKAGRIHGYTGLLQLNAGGNTGGTFTATATGGTVSRPKASLSITVASTQGQPVLSQDLASHGASYGTLDQHVRLKADVTGSALALVTVLEPVAAGGPLPVARVVTANGGVSAVKLEASAYATLVVVTEPGVTATLPSSSTGLPEVETDGSFVWLRFQGSTLLEARQEGASILTVGGVSAL